MKSSELLLLYPLQAVKDRVRFDLCSEHGEAPIEAKWTRLDRNRYIKCQHHGVAYEATLQDAIDRVEGLLVAHLQEPCTPDGVPRVQFSWGSSILCYSFIICHDDHHAARVIFVSRRNMKFQVSSGFASGRALLLLSCYGLRAERAHGRAKCGCEGAPPVGFCGCLWLHKGALRPESAGHYEFDAAVGVPATLVQCTLLSSSLPFPATSFCEGVTMQALVRPARWLVQPHAYRCARRVFECL